MGWNVLAVGEIGDSRRLDVRLSGVGADSERAGVDIVADGEDDSASNAWILDWRDAEGMAEDELELDAPTPARELPSSVHHVQHKPRTLRCRR